MAIIRIVLGIAFGIVLAFAVVRLGDYLNHMLWPPRAEVDPTRPDQVRAYLATAPLPALLGLPLVWTVACFLGAFAAAKIAAKRWAGWITGLVAFAATLLNLAFLPHPLWMLVAALVFVPLAGCLGSNLGAPKRAA